jgi:deoxyribodipyrimidine photo-lyase
MEQELYGCIIGKNYPTPIIDIDETRKRASEIVWSYRKKESVKEEGKRILQNHTNSERMEDKKRKNTPKRKKYGDSSSI